MKKFTLLLFVSMLFLRVFAQGISYSYSKSHCGGYSIGLGIAGRTTSYVAAEFPLYSQLTSITLMAWVRPQVKLPANMGIIYRQFSHFPGSVEWGLVINSSGKFMFNCRIAANNGTGEHLDSLVSGVTADSGTWYHVAATLDANYKCNIYVNGKLAGSKTMSGPLASYIDIGGNYVYNSIGATSVNYQGNIYPGAFFKGYIDDAGISSIALTKAQVDSAANKLIRYDDPAYSFHSFWQFSEGKGSYTTNNGLQIYSNSGIGSTAYFQNGVYWINWLCPQPTITVAAIPGNVICQGTKVTLTATATDTSTKTAYQWQKNGANVGVNSKTYTDTSLKTGDQLKCILTDSGRTVTSNVLSFTVTPNVIPVVTITKSVADTICFGTLVIFKAVTVDGGDAPTYKWTKNGSQVGENSSEYKDSLLSTADAIQLQLTSNQKCAVPLTASSNIIKLIVNNVTKPSVTILADTGNTICKGRPVTFKAYAINSGNNPTYTWMRNGIHVGDNNAEYKDSLLKDGDRVWVSIKSHYKCAVPDSAESNVIVFTVKPLDTAAVSITSNAGNKILNSTFVTFNATPKNGGIYPVYQWLKNGKNVGADESFYADGLLKNGDSVQVLMVSKATCVVKRQVASNVIKMSVITPSVTIKSNKGDSICKATKVTFTATAKTGGFIPAYQWLKNGEKVGKDTSVYVDSLLNNGDSINCAIKLNGIGITTVVTSVKIQFFVATAVPAKPSVIAGPSSVFTGEKNTGYKVPGVAGVTKYNWTVSGTNTIANGKGTDSITINWGKTGGQATIAINETNVCGISPTANKIVTIAYTGLSDSIIMPAKPKTEYASYEYTDTAGWTHYYYDNKTPNDKSDDTLILSLKKNGQDIGSLGDGVFAVKLVATPQAGSNTGVHVTSPLITNASGYWVMNRYWQVTPTHEPKKDVGVRFYYNNQDLKDVNGSYPSHNLTNQKMIFYKIVGGDPNPLTNLAGATKIISILPGTYASDTTWTYHALSDSTQYSEYSVAGFSGGGGGGTGNNLALPIILSNFTGKLVKYDAYLQWQTTEEVSSSYFNVERSADGQDFYSIAKVAAAGNSDVLKNYNYQDAGIANAGLAEVYYRLKEVDKNGSESYSKIVLITLQQNDKVIKLSPNPAQAEAKLELNGFTAGVMVTVTDMAGKTVWKQEKLTNGVYTLQLGNLASGVYIVTVRDKNGINSLKLVKAK